jgi:hypothetical protein
MISTAATLDLQGLNNQTDHLLQSQIRAVREEGKSATGLCLLTMIQGRKLIWQRLTTFHRLTEPKSA